MSESRCPKLHNIDRKLADFCHFGQITVNSDIFCQLSVILDNFLSILCSLGHLDSDMFLSIRPLFPCSGNHNIVQPQKIKIDPRARWLQLAHLLH